MRAASCATPDRANRQFSPLGPGRDAASGRGVATRVPASSTGATGGHYDRSGMSTERVVIVGGGIIGTMHAREACRRGWEVTHLEADPGPRRASVRNFGLVWVSGRAP